MKTATKEDYQRLIEIGQHLLKGAAEQLPQLPADRIPVVRFGQGLDAIFVAVGHLMLGQVEDARCWFRQSAEYFLGANRQYDTVVAERRALECALFSGNKEFQVQVAQQIFPREGRIKPMEDSYMMFLKHMILNERTEALVFAEESAWLSRTTMKKRGGYGTLQETCHALACGQANEFAALLEALLREHKMKSSHGFTKVPDGIVCFPGAALLLLAREQGLSVNVTSPFIPEALWD